MLKNNRLWEEVNWSFASLCRENYWVYLGVRYHFKRPCINDNYKPIKIFKKGTSKQKIA